MNATHPSSSPAQVSRRKSTLTQGIATLLLTAALTLQSAAQAVRPGFRTASLPANDDLSTPIAAPLGFDVNFFGVSRNSVFVNNNGNVTFDSALQSFTPFNLTSTNRQIIAPFFADVDTRVGNVVQFGIGTVEGGAAFGVTSELVGYFSQGTDKLNTFQLVIIERADTGAGNFDFEFNYDQIQYETGSASGGVNGLGGSSARAGFSNGSGDPGTFFELAGSAVNGAFLDSGPAATALILNSLNSSQPGRYVFSVRNGIVLVDTPDAFWRGNVSNLWSDANWGTDANGAPTPQIPGANSDVIFSAAGALNQTTALGRDFEIKSLTVTDPTPVTIGGPDTLTISGSSGVTGIAVSASAGAVTIDAPVTLAGGSSTITVNNVAGLTMNGVLDGSIGLIKEGGGLLALNSESTYGGETLINNGELRLNGSIASDNTMIALRGMLSGSGRVGGNVVNAGMLSPGNSPGTFRIDGNFSQAASGTLRIEIAGRNSGQFDLLAVGGRATLAGRLQLVKLDDFSLRRGDKITFLTAAGGVSGEFDVVENPFATGTILGREVTYGNNAVALEAVQGSFADFVEAFDLPPDLRNVAEELDRVQNDSSLGALFDFLNELPLAEIPEALQRLAPEELTALQNITTSLANIQTSNLTRRLEDLRAGSAGFSASGFAITGAPASFSGAAGPTGAEGKSDKMIVDAAVDQRWGAFLTGVGEFAGIDDARGVRGYDISTGGFTLGVDYRLTDGFAIGLLTGYAHTQTDVSDGRIEVDGGKLGVYATYFAPAGGWFANAAITGGHNSYDTRRGGLGGKARSDTEGGELNTLLSLGYDWRKGGFQLTPAVDFQYGYMAVDGFTERGSLAPLAIDDYETNSFRSSLGLRASYDCKIGNAIFRPELRAAWQHEYCDVNPAVQSRFAGTSSSGFTVNGPDTGRDTLLIGAGAAVQWNARLATYVYYDGELGRTNYESHSVSAGFRISF